MVGNKQKANKQFNGCVPFAWFQTSTAAHEAVGTTNSTVTALKETIDDVELVINFTIATKTGEYAPELTRALDGKAGYLANGDTSHPYYQDATKPIGVYTISASWANANDATTWVAAGKTGASYTFDVKVTAKAQVGTAIYAQLIKSASTSTEDHAANTEGAPSTSEVRNVDAKHVYTVTINNTTGALSIASNEGKYCLRPGSEGVDTYVEAGYSGLFEVANDD